MRKLQKYNSSFLNLKVKVMLNAICKSKAFVIFLKHLGAKFRLSLYSDKVFILLL